MILILSPAKTLNFDKRYPGIAYTQPVFKNQAVELMELLKEYSPSDMAALMKISDELAEINFFRHQEWKKEHNIENSKQALLAFHGAVYQGLGAEGLRKSQLQFAQEHLRILSGLYGVIRPLDLVQPFRLEMGTKFRNNVGKDLYIFWKDLITNYFNEELNKSSDKILINLASNEYFLAIDENKLKGSIVTPVFKEYRKGEYKIITIYAKRARGLMTKYIIENGIDELERLRDFGEEGYEFNEQLSNEKNLVFIR